jgi:hypothetical protein
MGVRKRLVCLGAAIGAVAGGLVVGSGGPAAADGPGVGTPTVVTVGDSYISGEAGRWAGNTNKGSEYHDATGADTYFDNATRTAEQIARCHRSESAEAYIGGGVKGINLACSGARTATFFDSDGNFKPGLDRYSDSAGRKSQVLMLEDAARANNVKMVVVSIGGNDFNFASIVQTCVTNFLLSPSWWPNYCYDDSSVSSNFTSANVTAKTAAIRQAVLNVRDAMANAGYADGAYTILVQTYPSPIPGGSGFRYSQSGYTRQSTGGCGFWNKDADWANTNALVKINGAVRSGATGTGLGNVKILELQSTMNGRRLCENTVGLLEEKGLASWTSAGAVDKTEWVNQIRTVSTIGSAYFVQESIHPSYWGQLAVRSCVRQAYTANRGGTCTRTGTGLTTFGEPVMTLQ